MPVWSDLGKSEVKEKPLARLPQACGGGRGTGWPCLSLGNVVTLSKVYSMEA